MHTKGSRDLFDLIRSMTTEEKRLFRYQASFQDRSRYSVYMRLFEVMDDSEHPDDEKFREQSGISNFSVAKNRLYYQLLRFLSEYNAEEDPKNDLQEKLADARHLYRRALNDQAERLLTRIIEKSMHLEFYSIAKEAIEILLLQLPAGEFQQSLLSLLEKVEEQALLTSQLRSTALMLEKCYLKGDFSDPDGIREEVMSFAHSPGVREFSEGTPEQEFWHAMIRGYLALIMGVPHRVVGALRSVWINHREGINSGDPIFTKRNKLALLCLRCSVVSGLNVETLEVLGVLRNTYLQNGDHKSFLALEIQFALDQNDLPSRKDHVDLAMRYLDRKDCLSDDIEVQLAFQCARFFFRAGNQKELKHIYHCFGSSKEFQSCSYGIHVMKYVIMNSIYQGETELAISFTRSYARKLKEHKRNSPLELYFLPMVRKLNGAGLSRKVSFGKIYRQIFSSFNIAELTYLERKLAGEIVSWLDLFSKSLHETRRIRN